METKPVIRQTSTNYDVLSKMGFTFQRLNDFIIITISIKNTVIEVLKARPGRVRWPRAGRRGSARKGTD